MITVKNISTGEIHKVTDTRVREGRIITDNNVGERFVNKHSACVSVAERTEDGRAVLIVNDGWELVVNDKKPRTPKAAKADTKVDAAPVEMEKVIDADAVVEVRDEQPTTAPVEKHRARREKKTEQPVADDNERALIDALKALKGGSIDAAKVAEIVRAELEKLAQDEPTKVKRAAKKLAAGSKKTDEVYCAKFDRILAKVRRGNNVYLYGRAGSGKSHTAEQIAQALGLPFYGQTTVQFAHDVRGYGDAGGNFVETPFFKAFANGGVYFQDEYDRSNAEAAIVLNSALANGWYDFPVVGRVEAHDDFRFIAAGNTTMSGPDEEYVTGQVIDASSRDRFAFFFNVDYSHEVEIRIAHGDADTVAFVEDVREAILATGIKHVVSYRATQAMTDERENENDKQACITEAVFKGLEIDEMRIIYGALKNKFNPWAKALKAAIG